MPLRAAFLLVLLLPVTLFAQGANTTCHADTAPASEADIARYRLEFGRAYDLYGKDPANPVNAAGRVLTRLREARFKEAQALADSLVAQHPQSVEAHTVRAQVLLARLQFDASRSELATAQRLNPCYGRMYFVSSLLEFSDHRLASAWKRLTLARQLAPNDGDIERRWLYQNRDDNRFTLQADYVAHTPNLADQDRAQLRNDLIWARAVQAPGCTVVATEGGTSVPLRHDAATGTLQIPIELDKTKHDAAISIAGGISISPGLAKQLGLTHGQIFQSKLGPTLTYPYYITTIPSLRIGTVELRNCTVTVEDDDVYNYALVPPSIGLDVLSDFLVDLDPGGTLALKPLPELQGAQRGTWSTVPTSPEGTQSRWEGSWPNYEATIPKGMEDWTRIYDLDGYRMIMGVVGPGQPLGFLMSINAHNDLIEPDHAGDTTSFAVATKGNNPPPPKETLDTFKQYPGFVLFSKQLTAVQQWSVAHPFYTLTPDRIDLGGILGYPTLGQLAYTFDLRDGLVKTRRANVKRFYPGFNNFQ